ncbi:MAG: protein-glutamate O-methyltransferase CheR [Polyangiaceae bacterium]|nr:protein-glutamate O-methyltransferase CheR [Polyangiaceae bacterium]
MKAFSSSDDQPRLRADDFRLLRDLVNDHAGLHFDDGSLYLFERRLGERVAALELGGFDEYYKYLRFNARGKAEIEESIERLTTKETYFFRQEYQLRSFANELLPRLAEANRDSGQLTVWSAGCSTGEEAYTVAILIARSGLFQGWNVRVVGSDISRRNVATARRGTYRAASFRTTPPEIRREYFVEEPEGVRVVERIRAMCHFGQLNLLDRTRAALVGRADAVFCRNVLIYFDMRSRKKVIDNLYDRLTPGGFLMLGHSESLLNVSTAFELVHLSEDLVYRKPLAARRWDGSSP